MNNMNKWVLLAVVAIIVVVAIAIFARPQQRAAPSNSSSEAQNQTFDPKNPGFILGSVTKVSANEIEFKAGPTASKAQISSNTKLVKQVRDKSTKLISVVDATVADFSNGDQIVVYFSSPAKDGVYQADKIQIISK